MNISEKNRYKVAFKKALDKFTDKLEKYVSTENGDWRQCNTVPLFSEENLSFKSN